MDYILSTLPNQLRVLTVPMPDRDSAGVAIWVRAGARDESKKLSGASHFLEHMLFKGTKKRTTRQIKEEIEGVGGMLNAFTGEESTCYFAKLLSQHTGRALDVLSDMVNHATLDLKELTKERTVILEEIKMYRDLPASYVHELMGELLWPNQPLGRPIAGTYESVSGISRTDLANYKEEYYHPANILVTVSGAVKHDEIIAQVKEAFGKRAPQKTESFVKAVSRQNGPRTLFVDKKTEQTHFVIGLHAISRFHPDRYKLGLLNVILGANMSSRLFEEVREKRGLAYEIRSGLGFYHDTGSFSVSAGVETSKAPKAIDVILKELVKMQKTFVTEGELRRAKDYFMSQLYMALEDTLEHLLWAGERVLDRGQLPNKAKIRKGIEAVTRQDIRDVAQKLFLTKHLNLALIGPLEQKAQNLIKENFAL